MAHRPRFIDESLDNRLVKFPDQTTWQLTKQLTEKPWEGSRPEEREGSYWSPSEVHAVYECLQTGITHPRRVAIMKIRIEVPYELPPSDDPKERAKEASGMRLSLDTKFEIQNLERLTAAGCAFTPKLLAVQIDIQDETVLQYPQDNKYRYYGRPGSKLWMPGGYIVYILMEKLPAEPLAYDLFWDEKVFTKHDRDQVRHAFKKAYIEVRKLGFYHEDTKIQNLMWNKDAKKCYIIDWEMAAYDPATWAKPPIWFEDEYYRWHLARRREEPHC